MGSQNTQAKFLKDNCREVAQPGFCRAAGPALGSTPLPTMPWPRGHPVHSDY